MKKDKCSVNTKQANKFGTFGGVFTPSVLTILGVIMYLRFPTVIGYSGSWGVLLILFFSTCITFITGLSVSSIATNMRVRGGGAYYMISRSLGVEFGTVIAIFFYIAQSLAVSLYIIGFTEAIFSFFPTIGIPFVWVATIANILVFILVYVGADWSIRAQYLILVVVLLSIISFLIGSGSQFSLATFQLNSSPIWTNKITFFTMFALFFPAVTGIMAGVNMSGDLKNPTRSLPTGTLWAIGFTTVIYIAMAFFLASSPSREVLLGDTFVISDLAKWGILVYAGVICATISSAIGSMMGAPRILQAFSKDNIFPWLQIFGKGTVTKNEPRNAIVLTFVISQIAIFIGDLDTIAPVITMFFLITYGTINLACFYESITKNPSFRPTFRLNHWVVSLAGAVSCLFIMFLMNIPWASVAILLSYGMYTLVQRSQISVSWGNVRSGTALQVARNALLRLEREKYHPKNWRLSVLVLSGGIYNRLVLTTYATLLSGQRGIVSLAQIIIGRLEDYFTLQPSAEKQLRKFILTNNLMAFPVAVVDVNFTEGLKSLIQCHGIGGLRPNTILLGWSGDPDKSEAFQQIISIVRKMDRNMIIVRSKSHYQSIEPPCGAINVWWEESKNGSMMLMLAHLLKENREWRDCPLRLLRTVPCKANVEDIMKKTKEMLAKGRIKAEIVILPCDNNLEAIQEAMEPSAVLFAGFHINTSKEGVDTYTLDKQIMTLPGDIILVRSTEHFSLTE